MHNFGKNSVNIHQKLLIHELQSLRKGAGLTRGKLENTPNLRSVVARRTGIEASSLTASQLYNYLVSELDTLGDNIEARAVRQAFAIRLQNDPQKLTARRGTLSRELGRHPDTLEAYENKGIIELANRLMDWGSQLHTDTHSTTDAVSSSQRVATAARNMVTQGLSDLYSLGMHAAEIHDCFGYRKAPYLDSAIEMNLLPSKQGGDFYMLKFRHTFRTELEAYRIAVVSTTEECERFMASGLVDDVIKLNSDENYQRELATLLNNCSLGVHDAKKSVHESLRFTQLNADAKRNLLEPLWNISGDGCEILEVPVKGQHSSDALYEYRLFINYRIRDEQYVYWYAPGLTYLNSLTIDLSRFPGRRQWRLQFYPFLVQPIPAWTNRTAITIRSHPTVGSPAATAWL